MKSWYVVHVYSGHEKAIQGLHHRQGAKEVEAALRDSGQECLHGKVHVP